MATFPDCKALRCNKHGQFRGIGNGISALQSAADFEDHGTEPGAD